MIVCYHWTCRGSCCSSSSMIDAPACRYKVISWSNDKWWCFSCWRNIFRDTSKSVPAKSIVESKSRNVNRPVLVCQIVIICFNKSLIRAINSKSISLIVHCRWLSVASWVKCLSRLIISYVCNNIPRETSYRSSWQWRRILKGWDCSIKNWIYSCTNYLSRAFKYCSLRICINISRRPIHSNIVKNKLGSNCSSSKNIGIKHCLTPNSCWSKVYCA